MRWICQMRTLKKLGHCAPQGKKHGRDGACHGVTELLISPALTRRAHFFHGPVGLRSVSANYNSGVRFAQAERHARSDGGDAQAVPETVLGWALLARRRGLAAAA